MYVKEMCFAILSSNKVDENIAGVISLYVYTRLLQWNYLTQIFAKKTSFTIICVLVVLVIY